MNWARTIPVGVVGGIVGWEAAKAILVPMVVWSSTAAGAAVYVNWVIDSNRVNTRLLMVGNRNDADPRNRPMPRAPRDEAPGRSIADELDAMVAARVAFLRGLEDRDAAVRDRDARLIRRDDMVREDVLMFDQADRLRRLPSDVVGSDIVQKIAALRQLDDRLRAIGAADP